MTFPYPILIRLLILHDNVNSKNLNSACLIEYPPCAHLPKHEGLQGDREESIAHRGEDEGEERDPHARDGEHSPDLNLALFLGLVFRRRCFLFSNLEGTLLGMIG